MTTLRLKESESPETGLRRLAIECIDWALEALDESDGRDVAIHTVRKQCKKARALLRLYRFGLGPERKRESLFYRDLGRSLSSARDGKVALDVHAQLMDQFGAMLDPAVGAAVRQELIAHVQAGVSTAGEIGGPLAENDTLRQRLIAARTRARRWSLAAGDNGVLSEGLSRTYRRSRKATKRAAAAGSAVAMHEARKRAKDYWYQLEFVARRWPDIALDRIAPTRKFTDLLGDAHDLEVYCAAIRAAANARDPAAVEILSALAERRRNALEAEALKLGLELFLESPKQFAARLTTPEQRQHATG